MRAVTAPTKPLLRGVSHQFACLAALVAGSILMASAPNSRAFTATSIYTAAMVLLFGVSAAYHRRTWRPGPQLWMKRLDHASIFVLIAGSYTPVCMLAMYKHGGATLLAWVYTGAAIGIAQALFWPGAPRALVVSLYLALGWLMLLYMSEAVAGLGPSGIAWVMAGGLSYSIGALIYAFRRPDPIPSVFGYHEVFHALVIIASICHFVAIYTMVHASGALAAS